MIKTLNILANIILNGKKSEVFLLRSEKDKGAHPHHSFNIVKEVLGRSIKQDKKIQASKQKRSKSVVICR